MHYTCRSLGLSKGVWDTTCYYTHSHLQILTPCLEVFVLYCKVHWPLRAPPIRCRLCHRRRIKQLMQYPPFSIPPIKGFVQKAFFLTSSTVTYTSYTSNSSNHISLGCCSVAGVLLCAPRIASLGETFRLHSLLRILGLLDVGLTFPLFLSFCCPRGTGLVVPSFFLPYCQEYLGPRFRMNSRTPEAVPPLAFPG